MLIFIGILLILYPKINDCYISYWENRIKKEWENENNKQFFKSINDLNKVFEEEINTQGNIQQTSKIVEVTSNVKILGYLKIEKIDLKLPILQGSDKNTLEKGVGFIEGTGKIGEIGNAALAAHRSYTYGKFFNRLNELDEGDKIIIETKEAFFYYSVFEKVIVNLDDTYILNGNNEESIISLITCHPLREATHRLIIKAELEEKREE